MNLFDLSDEEIEELECRKCDLATGIDLGVTGLPL
jgi:hypothetical protein